MRFLITETFQFLMLAHIDILTDFSIIKLAKTAKIRCGSHCYDICRESVPEGNKFAVAYCFEMFLFWYLSMLSPDGCFAFRSSWTFKFLKFGALPGRATAWSVAKFFINVTVRSKTSWLRVFLGSHEVLPCVLGTILWAHFSKVPVIYGPVNLPGPLSGNFIGPEVAFLEAPVNFPGTYRGPEKIAGCYQTLSRSLYGRPQEKENELELYFIRIIRFVRLFERTVFLCFFCCFFVFEGQCNMF